MTKKVLLLLFLSLTLMACKNVKEPKADFIMAEFRTNAIQKQMPDFTEEDSQVLSDRLIAELSKTEGLETKKEGQLTALRKEILKNKSNDIFKGYDYSPKEIEVLVKNSTIAYTKEGFHYGEDITTKEVFVTAGFQREMIQKQIPDFTEKDSQVLSERLMAEISKVKDLETKKGDQLTALRKEIFKDKSQEIFKGFDYSPEEMEILKENSMIAYTMDGTYYGEDRTNKIEVPEEYKKEDQSQNK